MLLVVKHVKVVFILYNTCTCTHDIVQAAAWCTLTIVSTCLGSCETRSMVEKSAAPERERNLRQWITRRQLQASVALYPGSSPENEEGPGYEAIVACSSPSCLVIRQ